MSEPMLDIALFRDIRFSAASFSIAAAFFGLFGFIFLITQYFQLVHGTKMVVPAGLLLMAAGSSSPRPSGPAAVNDVTRELGGTFGVAVVGAVFSSAYGPQLARLLPGASVPASAIAAARQSPAAALQVAGQASASARAVIIGAADCAFVAGLSRGSLVCAGVVALGALFAFFVLPRRLPGSPPSPAGAAPRPEQRARR